MALSFQFRRSNPLLRHLKTQSAPFCSTSLVIKTLPFNSRNIDPPLNFVETKPRELVSLFRDMLKMRRVEIAAVSLFNKRICGSEALPVGMEAALTEEDAIITSQRDHAIFLARGASLSETFDLIAVKDARYERERASLYFYGKDSRFFGWKGIIGSKLPLGCGIASAQKFCNNRSVTFALYGEDAASEAVFCEDLSIAAQGQLPLILVCETSRFADGMGASEWKAEKSLGGNDVPGLKVDAMDVLAVKKACSFAKKHALNNGPIILEMDTYRCHGHSKSDPGSTQKRDPIAKVRELILSEGICNEIELKNIEREIRREVDEAIAKAKESALPASAQAFEPMVKRLVDDYMKETNRNKRSKINIWMLLKALRYVVGPFFAMMASAIDHRVVGMREPPSGPPTTGDTPPGA